MSDHGKDDHGHGHGAKKPSLGQKLAGVAVGTILILIFLYFVGTTVPNIVTAAANLMGNTGNALIIFKEAIRDFFINFRAVIREIIVGLVIPGIFLFFVGKYVKEWLIPKKKDDGHDHGGGHH